MKRPHTSFAKSAFLHPGEPGRLDYGGIDEGTRKGDETESGATGNWLPVLDEAGGVTRQRPSPRPSPEGEGEIEVKRLPAPARGR